MKSKKLAIVTGCTSGIGLATIEALSKNGFYVHGIARNKKKVKTVKEWLSSYEVHDFSETLPEKELLEDLDFEDFDLACLVNNAGTLEPIGPFYKTKVKDLESAFRVNFLSCFQMTKHFYRKLLQSRESGVSGRVIQVSTGAAFHPYSGWTAYCSSKAALWLFTQVAAEEMDTTLCQVMSLAPGVVESGMQELIRSQSPDDFPKVESFRAMHSAKRLYTPDVPAKFIAKLLLDKAFPHGKHVDLRESQK